MATSLFDSSSNQRQKSASEQSLNTGRRELLRAAGSLCLAGFVPLSACKIKSNNLLIGGYSKQDGRHGVACLSAELEAVWELECEARVHEIAIQAEHNLGAVAARRPGEFIQLFEPTSGTRLQSIPAPEGMQFEGHLLFGREGSLSIDQFGENHLWATASTQESSQGALLRFDLNALDQSPEILLLPGLGPHQIVAAGGSRVWVAIGGWHTEDREILNESAFESKLLLIDLSNGEILSWETPDSSLSVRHLCVPENGQSHSVLVALQYAVPKPTAAPLVYRFSKDQSADKLWTPLSEPEGGWQIFRGYIGSVAASENWIAATSPQGHQVALWDASGAEFLAHKSLMDAGGAANVDGKPWLSSGSGQVFASSLEKKVGTPFHWDNHWTSFRPNDSERSV